MKIPQSAIRNPQSAIPTRAAKVCIVDPRPGDYAPLLTERPTRGMRLEFLPKAVDALHAARTGDVAVWVVNMRLPDIPGVDLCRMLKSRCPGAVVYLVTDRYCPDEERAAWTSGAALFDEKPVRPAWFDRFTAPDEKVEQVSQPA